MLDDLGFEEDRRRPRDPRGRDPRDPRNWDARDPRDRDPRDSRGQDSRGLGNGRKKKRKKRRGRSGTALIITVVLLLILGGGAYWGYGQLQNNQSFREFRGADYAQSDVGDEVTFTVENGAGGTRIANDLLAADVIKSRTAFVKVCDANSSDCKGIQPGSYTVHLHSPAQAVFDILVDPKNKIALKFTIPEGMTVIETLQSLATQTGIPLADFQAAIKDPASLGIDPSWYATDPEGNTTSVTTVGHPEAVVEGFLFPDTYFYEPTNTATDILKLMVADYKSTADSVGLSSRAAVMGVTPYEILITASIAQAEGTSTDDFGKIARVIYNRVFKWDMNIGVDTSVNYWLQLTGGEKKASKDLTYDDIHDTTNPYNTYEIPAFPVGPISNPGKDALTGAANPTVGDWRYFVGFNGKTYFSVDEDGFCQSIYDAIAAGELTQENIPDGC